MKPPHTDTIELTPNQLRRGAREQQFSVWLAEYRADKMGEEEWAVLMQWPDFSSWVWRH